MTLMRFFLVLLLLLARPAMAAPGITPEGAQQLRTVMNNFMAIQKKAAEAGGTTKVTYEGEVVVEEAGDYYAVTLPFTKITYNNGEHLDVGMISVNASHADDPGQWKMRLALPTPLVVQDAANAEIMKISLGTQNASGIWDEKIQNFVKLDALYKDIAVTSPAMNAAIPVTTVIYDFKKEAGSSRLSGPSTITLSNPAMTVKTDQGSTDTVTAKEVKLLSMLDRYDWNAMQKYRSDIADLSTQTQNGKLPASAIADKAVDFFANSGNGISFQFDVSSFEAAISQPQPRRYTLDKGSFSLSAGGFLTGKVEAFLKGNFSGLAVMPPDPALEGIAPSFGAIDISVKDIPFKEILELARSTVMASAQSPETAQIANISFLFKLPMLLGTAGTGVTITQTSIGNKDYDLLIDAHVKAKPTEATAAVTFGSFTGSGKSVFKGLDPLIARVKVQADNPQNVEVPYFRNLHQQLTVYKNNAREEKTITGGTSHIIDFSLDPNGQFLMNGKPPGAGAPIPAP